MRAAAIVAGGRAARLGGACKPLLTVAGAAILDRQLAVLRPLVDELFVVTNDTALAAACAARGLRAVPDLRPGAGPLAGLEAALLATRAGALLLVAGDLPALAPRAVELLLHAAPEAEAVVPFVAGRAQPLLARYAAAALARVQARLDGGRLALRDLLDDLRLVRLDEPAWRAVDPDLLSLADVDTAADLAHLEARLAAR